MKRLLFLTLLLVLGGCHSQSRVVHHDPHLGAGPDSPREPREHWTANPRTADEFTAKARREIRAGRLDDARVTLHQAFSRDRWHPGANTLYQDAMLERGGFDIVWREYTDLYHAWPLRGDALWFHLRPLLLKDTRLTPEAGRVLTDEQRLSLETAMGEARTFMDNGQTAQARKAVLAALDIDPGHIGAHRLAQDLWPRDELPGLIAHYDEIADENPASGDRLYLAARARARLDMPAAIEMLRGGLILGLPGLWLAAGMAELAQERAQDERESRRSRDGFNALAARLRLMVEEALPETGREVK